MVSGIRSLTELLYQGGTVQATCRACGRVALFSPYELAHYFRRRGWDDGWPGFAGRLRCSGLGGCGAREPNVAWLVGDPPPESDPPPPRPRLNRNPGRPRPTSEEWERARERRLRRAG